MFKKKKNIEPKYYLSPLNNEMINYKVYYMSGIEKILYILLTLIAGGLSGLIFYGGLFKVDGESTTTTYISNIVVFVLVGLIATKIFMPILTKKQKDKRDRKLKKQFLDFLEHLSASLAAGNTVNDAFLNARDDLLNQYSADDMIVIEISEIVTGIENGLTLEEMVFNFGERSGNEDIQNFSNVVTNCYRLGGDFKSVVRKTRDVISNKIAVGNEIDTKLASNKLQHNVMSIMPIVLVGMLKMTSSMFADKLSSVVGVTITTVAVGIFILAYIWGQKIIKIK